LNCKVFLSNQHKRVIKMENPHPHELLRKTALAIALAGALLSLIFVLHAGRHNKSIILPLLFVFWVLSPFATLVAANVGKRRLRTGHATLYWLTIVIAVVSAVGYSGVLSSPGANLTPLFLLLPLLTLIVIAIFILVTKSKSPK
jgi:uncharacterized membrane protein YhaH (DUF805 family)